MRKLIVIVLLFFMPVQYTSAQLTTTLVMSSTPPARITNWQFDNTILTYIISSQQDKTFAIIKTELKLSDGTLIATMDLTKASLLSVSEGNSVYHAKDVLPLSIMQFNGRYKTIIDRTGLLPSGNYQLSVQIVSPQGYAPLAPQQVKNFFIPVLQLPVLAKPYNNQHLNVKEAQTAIVFRWSPLMPKTAEVTNYRIQAFEVYSYQQDVQAMRSNAPLLDVVVKMQTQYIWRPQISFIDDSVKKFIWTIQSLDAAGNVISAENSNQESRSEPFVFYVE